jgi:hypothetical protein
MGKVKQAIQEVEEQVMDIVQGSKDITLPDVQTILFKRYWHKNDNGYFLNEDVVKNAYNKAIWERDNEQEYYRREDVL